MVSLIGERTVLDHGYVRLLEKMGDDWSIVDAARVSYGQERKGPEQDTKLIRYLLKNGHTSPFEMVEMKWEVRAPIFVAREWVRHRTANWNEISARYTQLEKLWYVPDELRIQNTEGNKQGSNNVHSDTGYWRERIEEHCSEAYNLYETMIANGVAREQARMILPLNTYTRWIWKNDLSNTLKFLKLRCAENAQWEIRQYANAMREMLNYQLPTVMGIVEEEGLL